MITIVDYGMGNLGSIHNMMKRIGVKSIITDSLQDIQSAQKIILPGVGAFDHAMNRINTMGFRSILDQKALEEKIPILGICLGMQLLTKESEEGKEKGLGWISARTKRFPPKDSLKVPHMGWNIVKSYPKNNLTQGFNGETRFYFVHSYFVDVDNEANSLFKTDYGVSFDSGIIAENIMGVQFHPEKSHRFGMQLLKNFAEIS